MARNHSVIVMLAIAAFLSLSFFMSFGRRSDVPVQKSLSAPDMSKDKATEPIVAAQKPKPVFTVKPETGVQLDTESKTGSKLAGLDISSDLLTGDVIAPKLENATAKAELGRASWKLFHTMMARFPEKPTEDDSLALKTYIQLFARLYPCGDCAKHFQGLLKHYPPQVGSRNSAAGWACFVHNQVNERLEKDTFDCTKIGDFYDCGCGDEDGKGKKQAYKGPKSEEDEAGELKKDGLTKAI